MNVDDNFYDELSSFMPSPDDYGLHDLTDIIGSTVPTLDPALELPNFGTQNAQTAASLFDLPACHEFDLNFSTFPSPTTTSNESTSSSSYCNSQRTPSTSSMDGGDYANLDELMNFINDDDMKMDELTHDSLLDQLKSRNTPSPTGSCSSSGGSSTSGVHSDSSSVVSMQTNNLEQPQSVAATQLHNDEERSSFTIKDETTSSYLPSNENHTQPACLVPASNVVLPTLITLPTVHVLPGTLVPVQTVPLTNTNLNTNPNLPIKIEPKLAPKHAAATVTQITAPATTVTKTTTPVVTVPTSAPAPTPTVKTTQPLSTKPKTIFLSSNDFKALMQKMNSNGKSGGAKINGSVNAQLPKIIMKAANGKVISANKIVQPLNATNLNATKLMKTNTAVNAFAKPEQQQQAIKLLTNNRGTAVNGGTRHQHATATPTAAAATTTKPPPNDVSVYKGMIDEKLFKKQQRMIKNRESASLSRKKKKEYVVALETRIHNLEKENCSLKTENASLRNQLVAFAQTCNCSHGNVSEFVLNSLNAAAKSEHHHVKIAPKPSPKSLKQRMTAANVKKNVAVLFAMAFMVTLNVGNFQSYLNKNNLENEGSVVESIAEEPMATGRRLLWVETEQEYTDKLNRSKRAVEMEVPPLHFLRPVNRTGSSNNATTANSSATTAGEEQPPGRPVEPPLSAPKCNGGCAMHANQTENLRLASNLRKWIGGNDYLNLSMHTRSGNGLDNPHGFKLTTDYMELKTNERHISTGKRKIYMDDSYDEDFENDDIKRKRKLDTETDYERERISGNEKGNGNGNVDENSLKLYKPKIEEEYLRLFRGIKRQEDTFYVLSFNMDHILLPASAHNKTTRPKMSLMLPAGDPTINGDIILMQIDCEVFNTTQLKLKSHMIPEKLRQNIKMHATPAKPTDVANNETAGSAASVTKTRDLKLPLKYEPPKAKPAVRTYFMVGPKNQAAAAASQQKPRIVKFNSSIIDTANSIPNYGGSNMKPGLNIKNSTLFAKMRDTVRGEFGP